VETDTPETSIYFVTTVITRQWNSFDRYFRSLARFHDLPLVIARPDGLAACQPTYTTNTKWAASRDFLVADASRFYGCPTHF